MTAQGSDRGKSMPTKTIVFWAGRGLLHVLAWIVLIASLFVITGRQDILKAIVCILVLLYLRDDFSLAFKLGKPEPTNSE